MIIIPIEFTFNEIRYKGNVHKIIGYPLEFHIFKLDPKPNFVPTIIYVVENGGLTIPNHSFTEDAGFHEAVINAIVDGCERLEIPVFV